MSREKMEIGLFGERVALDFLKRRGYKVLKTNLRTPFGEIDCIARHMGNMVFAEIKTRVTSSLGPPYISVTRAKQMHIIKSALFYLKGCGAAESDWRIDVVSVKLNDARQVEYIEILENAVEGT